MEALQEVFDKALQENADVLNEKKQLEETQKDAADSPRLWNKEGRIATSLQWREAQKHWSRGRETATRKKMQGYAVQHPSHGDNIHLKALYNKAQCANTEIQEEKQRQEKSQEDTQSLLEELLKRRQKDMHEKNKEVREKTDEKQETLEELEKHCKNLEVQDEHFFTDMTNLIAQNKDLQEICLKKKRKQFGIFWKKDFFPRLASSSSFRG